MDFKERLVESLRWREPSGSSRQRQADWLERRSFSGIEEAGDRYTGGLEQAGESLEPYSNENLQQRLGEFLEKTRGIATEAKSHPIKFAGEQLEEVGSRLEKGAEALGGGLMTGFGETMGAAYLPYAPDLKALVTQGKLTSPYMDLERKGLLTPEVLESISPASMKDKKQVINEAGATAAYMAAPYIFSKAGGAGMAGAITAPEFNESDKYNVLKRFVDSKFFKATKPAAEVGEKVLGGMEKFITNQWQDRIDFMKLSSKEIIEGLTDEEETRLAEAGKNVVMDTFPMGDLAVYKKTIKPAGTLGDDVIRAYKKQTAMQVQNYDPDMVKYVTRADLSTAKSPTDLYKLTRKEFPKTIRPEISKSLKNWSRSFGQVINEIPITKISAPLKQIAVQQPNVYLNMVKPGLREAKEKISTFGNIYEQVIQSAPEEIRDPISYIKNFWKEVIAPAPDRAIRLERAGSHMASIPFIYVLNKMRIAGDGQDETAALAIIDASERAKELITEERHWGESMEEAGANYIKWRHGDDVKTEDIELKDIGVLAGLGAINLFGDPLIALGVGKVGRVAKSIKEAALYKKVGQIKSALPKGVEIIKPTKTTWKISDDLMIKVYPSKNEIVVKGFAKRFWKPEVKAPVGKSNLEVAIKDLKTLVSKDTKLPVTGVMKGDDLVLQPTITTRAIASEEGFAKIPGVKAPVSKELEPLAVEAKKYKTPEEFARGTFEIPINKLDPMVTREVLEKTPSKSKGPITAIVEKDGSFTMVDGLHRYFEAVDRRDSIIKVNFDTKNSPTKQQLTDIWNQAQKVESTEEVKEMVVVPKTLAQVDEINTEMLTKFGDAAVEKTTTIEGKEVKYYEPPVAKEPEWAVKKEVPMLPAPKDYATGEGFEMKPGKKATAKQILAREKPKKLKEKLLKDKGITDIQERIMRKQADLPPVNQMKPEHIAKYKKLIDDFDKIEVLPGKKLKDAVKIKVEPNKQVSSVITKQDLAKLRKDFKGKIKPEWVKKWSITNIADTLKSGGRVYELPQIFFENTGLKKYIYDPIRHYGERAASAEKTKLLNRFKEAKLYKEGGWFTADKFQINKRQSKQIGKYYLERQGKKTGVKYADLKPKEKKFVDIFDDIIKDTEDEFFAVARHNGKEINKVKNYAPLMTSDDITRIDKGGDMDFIMRKHPAFFSLKEREKFVPVNMYETDYRKVASRWIDGITKFNKVGQFTPQVKHLINSEEFKNIVGADIAETTNVWFKSVLNPDVPTNVMKGVNALARFLRKTTAVASLGLNYASVIKQVLTQVPLTIIEKAPPKLRSQYAKDFGIKVSDLPSIQERKGMISIADMQDKLGRAFTGPLAKFDKTNAQLSLNRLLDKNYKKYLKQGAEVSPELQDLILKKSQDTLDMWYGGMSKSQLSPAFRTDVGKLVNMFIQPLTSQLNGFFQSVFKAKGIRKFEKFAEVAVAAVVIAYMEQVITNLSFDWDDKKSMVKDTLGSLAGNIPVLSQLVYAVRSDQPIQATALLSGANNLIKEINKEEKDFKQIGLKSAEILGLPKQFRRTTDGIKVIKEEGVVDRRGKLLAPVTEPLEQIRAFLRGKYGALAAQDYVANIGKTRESRSWNNPEVEFLQNGDWIRRMEVMDDIEEDDLKSLVNKMSDGQKEEYNRWRFAKESPDATAEELGAFYKSVDLDKDGKMSSVQYEAFEEKVRLLEFQEQEPDIHEKILKNKEIEKISTDNALRAKYIFKELMKKSKADQQEWYAELKEKEIIDDTTDKHLNELWENPNLINK